MDYRTIYLIDGVGVSKKTFDQIWGEYGGAKFEVIEVPSAKFSKRRGRYATQ